MLHNIRPIACISWMLIACFAVIAPLSSAWAQTPEAPPLPTEPVVVATEAPVPTQTPVPTVVEQPVPPVETQVPVETAIPAETSPPETPVDTQPADPMETPIPVATETQVDVVPTEPSVPSDPPVTDDPANGTVPADSADPTVSETAVPQETPDETTEPAQSPETPEPDIPGTDAILEQTPESPAATESTEETGTPSPSPTPTSIPEVPDQLLMQSASSITINPGSSQDVIVRYVLGSDRESTRLSASLSALDGSALMDWTISPINRADLDEDPNDADRALKARVEITDVVTNGDVVDLTWRITAPAHIEQSVTIKINLSSEIVDEGITEVGVAAAPLVTVSAVASTHVPTLSCEPGTSGPLQQGWNCQFATNHPDTVPVTISAVIPEGWELTNGSARITNVASALNPAAIEAGGFSLEAKFPIGCPDPASADSIALTLQVAYPSGVVGTVNADLPLTVDVPETDLEITSFEFTGFDMRKSLATTGSLNVSFENSPCAWQATIEIADPQSDAYTAEGAEYQLMSATAPTGVTVTLTEGTIVIQASERRADDSSGNISVSLQVTIPQQIPPGEYRIGITTNVLAESES